MSSDRNNPFFLLAAAAGAVFTIACGGLAVHLHGRVEAARAEFDALRIQSEQPSEADTGDEIRKLQLQIASLEAGNRELAEQIESAQQVTAPPSRIVPIAALPVEVEPQAPEQPARQRDRRDMLPAQVVAAVDDAVGPHVQVLNVVKRTADGQVSYRLTLADGNVPTLEISEGGTVFSLRRRVGLVDLPQEVRAAATAAYGSELPADIVVRQNERGGDVRYEITSAYNWRGFRMQFEPDGSLIDSRRDLSYNSISPDVLAVGAWVAGVGGLTTAMVKRCTHLREPSTPGRYQIEGVAAGERFRVEITDGLVVLDYSVNRGPFRGAIINLRCPVSEQPIDSDFVVQYKKRSVALAGRRELHAFADKPSAFEARLPSLNAVVPIPSNTSCPVSGRPVNSRFAVVYEGRAVAFCRTADLNKFAADPGRYQETIK